MNETCGTALPGIARKVLARPTTAMQRPAMGPDSFRAQNRINRSTFSPEPVRNAPNPPASDASRGFAQFLAMASKRLQPGLDLGFASVHPVGLRSSLLSRPANPWSLLSTAGYEAEDDDPVRVGTVPFSDLIASAAKKYGVSGNLVAAVVKAESGFDPLAQSRAGAKGLMQLMDETARSLGVSNVFDPGQNLDGGVRFLSSLLRRYGGNSQLALAAYNAGPGAVEKYGGIPPYRETRDYLSRVMGYWRQFDEAGGRL
ncbi:MAG: lytic transglycosylase domain-containing protein [Chloroflexi bacterium]|nr:lytic transglycosylase domain-containing protein [Chloroflexota bacterium]